MAGVRRPRLATAEQTTREELANGITHGIGAVLSAAGLVLLLVVAGPLGDTARVIGVAVYGSSLVLLYLASTLYHSISHRRAKEILNVVDHAAIFLLIAGTYTPFTLVNMQSPSGVLLLAGVWALAACGMVFKLASPKRYARHTVLFYLGLGWLGIFAVDQLVNSTGGLLLVLAGGLAYTLGVPFYLWERLPYNHAIWHLFVLKGSALHFCAVLFYVLPPG